MKVIFDHNVPRRLRQFLTHHQVRTAREMGWAELENGELLVAAETAGFEVMVTGDQNLSYQQNLGARQLAIIVLSTNNWNILRENPRPVIAAIDAASPSSFQVIRLKPSGV